MNRVTISDVAKKAGVSKSTVSHVINKTRFVEDETMKSVLDAIEEMEYRPSSIARSLISKKTKTAGLLISDVGNPFYSEVILGVEEVALENGYNIFLCNTNYNLKRGMQFINSLTDKSVDGVLFMSSSMSIELIQELAKNYIPAVVLDWDPDKVAGKAATISINFSTGIYQAVQHLIELGHEKIAHISGPLDFWTAQKRLDDYLNALKETGLHTINPIVIEGNLRIDGGRTAFKRMMEGDQRPTAVIAANDLTALGVLWAARESGLKTPYDLSIIGLDDIELASKVDPPLTTIALPRFQIGNLAMTMLLDLIQKLEQSEYVIAESNKEVVTTLIIRGSTSKP